MRPGRGHLHALGFGAALVYALGYLAAIGDLNLHAAFGRVGIRVMPDPLSLMLQRRYALQFEAIAIVDLPWAVWLLSPVNLGIALGLGALVGINLVLGVRAFRQRACGVGGATAAMATVPALLSGAACCAPVTLLLLGVPLTGGLLALFEWLLPLAVVLLIASAVMLGRQSRG